MVVVLQLLCLLLQLLLACFVFLVQCIAQTTHFVFQLNYFVRAPSNGVTQRDVAAARRGKTGAARQILFGVGHSPAVACR